jgi:hypothetical protein
METLPNPKGRARFSQGGEPFLLLHPGLSRTRHPVLFF